MDKTEELIQLLNQMPDIYADVVKSVPYTARKYGITEDLIAFLKDTPDVVTDDIAVWIHNWKMENGIPADGSLYHKD